MTFGKVNIKVTDRTIQSPAGLKGVCAMAGQTERGNIGKAVLIRSFEEYRRAFGEILNPTTTQFPILAKRALDAGAPLYITRIAHLTDINDPATTTALKSSGNNSGAFPFAVTITGVDTGTAELQIAGDFTDYIAAGDSHVVNKVGGGTTALTVDAAGSSYSGGITTIVYTALLAGDAEIGDSLTWTSTLVNTLGYEAKNVGKWGNFVQVEIKKAASGIAGALDIFVSLTGSSNPDVTPSDLNQVYRDFPSAAVQTDLDAFNASEVGQYLQLTTFTAPIGVVPANLLTGGIDDYASVVVGDYLGSAIGETGIRAFDTLEKGDIVKIAVPEIVDNNLDQAVVQYAEDRGDCIAVLREPTGIVNGDVWIDWRNQSGAYSGTAIDNWRSVLLAGEVKIVSPYNGQEITIPTMPDYIGNSAAKDSGIGEWNNISNPENGFGILQNVNDLVYDINKPVLTALADDITNAGIIPTIKKKLGGIQEVTFWGSRTLQRVNSVLKFSTAAETVILIGNTIRPLAEKSLFKANNLQTWRDIYKDVTQAMLDLQNKSAIGEFKYEGDQDIDFISQATINAPANIANGEYKFNLYVELFPTLEVVNINIVASKQGTLITTQTA